MSSKNPPYDSETPQSLHDALSTEPQLSRKQALIEKVKEKRKHKKEVTWEEMKKHIEANQSPIPICEYEEVWMTSEELEAYNAWIQSKHAADAEKRCTQPSNVTVYIVQDDSDCLYDIHLTYVDALESVEDQFDYDRYVKNVEYEHAHGTLIAYFERGSSKIQIIRKEIIRYACSH